MRSNLQRLEVNLFEVASGRQVEGIIEEEPKEEDKGLVEAFQEVTRNIEEAASTIIRMNSKTLTKSSFLANKQPTLNLQRMLTRLITKTLTKSPPIRIEALETQRKSETMTLIASEVGTITEEEEEEEAVVGEVTSEAGEAEEAGEIEEA
jgi:hypothetical protein